MHSASEGVRAVCYATPAHLRPACSLRPAPAYNNPNSTRAHALAAVALVMLPSSRRIVAAAAVRLGAWLLACVLQLGVEVITEVFVAGGAG